MFTVEESWIPVINVIVGLIFVLCFVRGWRHEALEAASRLNTMNVQTAKEEDAPQNIAYKVGDAVELRSSSTVCQIIKIEKKEITILINGREMRVKKNQIRPSVHV